MSDVGQDLKLPMPRTISDSRKLWTCINTMSMEPQLKAHDSEFFLWRSRWAWASSNNRHDRSLQSLSVRRPMHKISELGRFCEPYFLHLRRQLRLIFRQSLASLSKLAWRVGVTEADGRVDPGTTQILWILAKDQFSFREKEDLE